jgi:hypothetical protein
LKSKVAIKKYFPALWIIALFISCSTVPPPKVENGTYINPEFGFSVKIPGNWLNSKPIPPWVLEQIPPSEKNNLVFMFTNTEPQLGMISKGRILASCSKLEISWEKLLLSWNKIRTILIRKLEKKKNNTDKESGIKKYYYRTYNRSKDLYLMPACYEEIDAYHLKLLTKCFYYRGSDQMAYKIIFYAISTPGMFNINSKAYRKMIRTFTIIDMKY